MLDQGDRSLVVPLALGLVAAAIAQAGLTWLQQVTLDSRRSCRCRRRRDLCGTCCACRSGFFLQRLRRVTWWRGSRSTIRRPVCSRASWRRPSSASCRFVYAVATPLIDPARGGYDRARRGELPRAARRLPPSSRRQRRPRVGVRKAERDLVRRHPGDRDDQGIGLGGRLLRAVERSAGQGRERASGPRRGHGGAVRRPGTPGGRFCRHDHLAGRAARARRRSFCSARSPAIQALAVSFTVPIQSLVTLGGTLQEAEGNLESLDDVQRYPREKPAVASKIREDRVRRQLSGQLEFEVVTFATACSTPPLIDPPIDLRHRARRARGRWLDGTGSGKSTIARLGRGRLYAPWAGAILFDGEPRVVLPRDLCHGRRRAVDQEIALFEAHGAREPRAVGRRRSPHGRRGASREGTRAIHEDITSCPAATSGATEEVARDSPAAAAPAAARDRRALVRRAGVARARRGDQRARPPMTEHRIDETCARARLQLSDRRASAEHDPRTATRSWCSIAAAWSQRGIARAAARARRPLRRAGDGDRRR